MSQRVFSFSPGHAEGDPSDRAILGGKGAGLMAMSAAGLPVPPGFTLSSACCREYLENGNAMPEGLEEELRAAMAELEKATGRTFGAGERPLLVSVRSGAAVSMPGMMDTLLNCGLDPATDQVRMPGFWEIYRQFIQMFGKTVAGIAPAEFEKLELTADAGDTGGEQAVTDAFLKLFESRAGRPFPRDPWETLLACVEAVFRSWNNERAVVYRKQHDVRGIHGTAVNVQAMFPSESSGVVFTQNPNNLAAAEMIVEASFGLGEAVVSGDVTPDHYVINRSSRALTKVLIGHKSHSVRAFGDTSPHVADARVLDDAQVAALAEMSMQVEEFFGHPVDLEWGLTEGEFALLQSRAIRGLEVAQEAEVAQAEEIKRLRHLAGEGRKIWISHNLRETLPQPTPMTWELIRRFMSGNGGFGKMYRDLGYRPDREVSEEGFLELICGRIYADPDRLAGLFWDGMPMAYDTDALLADPALMEAPPTLLRPENSDNAFLLKLPATVLAMLRSARRMRRGRDGAAERFEKEALPKLRAYLDRCRSTDLAALSHPELRRELERRVDFVLGEFAAESLRPGFFGGLACGRAERLLNLIFGRVEGQRILLELLNGLEGDVTHEQDVMLYRVAHGSESMDDFLKEFGHRAVTEMELAVPRWREDAAYLDRMLRAHHENAMKSPDDLLEENRRRRLAMEKALPEMLEENGAKSLLPDLLEDLHAAQALLPYRENGKHYLMMGYETLRHVLAEFSRRADLGRDLFFLKPGELGELEDGSAALTDRIAARKQRWEAWRRYHPARTIDSEDLSRLGLPPEYDDASEMRGDAVAAGIATGLARVVREPTESRDLGRDYVLVCPSTDPGWAALLGEAKGLVIERGGILSHGAIIARDFGIPAVVLPDATRRIPEGATVHVDGNAGTVSLANVPEEAKS